jgi:hypothetical protein
MGEEGRKKGEASRRKGGPVRGQGMTAAYYLAQTVVGLLFPFFFGFFFWGGVLWGWPWYLAKWVYNTPNFWTLPLHLGVLHLPFLMELGYFIFFQILFLLKLEYTWTFTSTLEIFVSWKKVKSQKNPQELLV